MRKTRRGMLLLAAVCALFACSGGAVLAQESEELGGAYVLEGTWWREEAGSRAGPAYMATINRTQGQSFTIDFQDLDNPFLVPWYVTTRASSYAANAVRTGLNEYFVTSVKYYSDELYQTDYRGTVYALICSGPLVQDSEDHFAWSAGCSVSCNPCYPACWNASEEACEALGERLWNPFEDDTAMCLVGPDNLITVQYRKVPLESRCLPED